MFLQNKIQNVINSISKNIFYLYLNRLLVQLAFGFLTGFGVIFFYQKFNDSISAVILLYILLYLAFAIFNHISAKMIKRFGMRNIMIFSLVGLSVMFLSRTFWDYAPYISLLIFFISFTIYKSFYWIPYHVEFASFTEKRNRGKQTAFLYNVGDLFAAIVPFIAGILLSLYGFNILFFIGFVFVILSILPLFRVEEVKEEYSWSFIKLVKEFFDKDNRPMIISSLGNGMQSIIGALIWPLFVFITIGNDFVAFGSILALVAIGLVVLRYFVGKYLDTLGREKVMRAGNFIYFTGWIFKMFVGGLTGIFLVDVYHRFGFVVNKTSFDVTTYDQAADNGHFIDEYTVLREVTFLIGGVIMGLIILPIVLFFNIKIAFLLGAIATVLMVSIHKQLKVE
jgi:MFS family permease